MPAPAARPPLAAALRALREEEGRTQEDVAIEAGITPSNLSKIERGIADPHWSTVEQLAHALGLTLADFGAAVDQARG